MLRVSGPQYLTTFQSNACHIILIGDEHFSTEGSCAGCKTDNRCMDIVQLLNHLEKPLDIFLESPVVLSSQKNKAAEIIKGMKSSGWLDIVTRKLLKYMYGKQKKEGLRVHYGDIRQHPSLYSLQWLVQILRFNKHDDVDVALSIVHDFKGKTYFKRYIDACIRKNDFSAEMNKLFGERQRLYCNDKVLTTFNGQRVHRVRKQILKLPPQMQRRLLRYYENESQDILIDYHNYHIP